MTATTTTTVLTYTIKDGRNPRARARTVCIEAMAEQTAEKAAATGHPSCLIRHGGSVANKYGYPASTQAGLSVAIPTPAGIVVATYGSELPANKVTLCGAANACMPGAGEIWDGRCGDARKQAARAAMYAQARRDILATIADELDLSVDPDMVADTNMLEDYAREHRGDDLATIVRVLADAIA